jgi:hypothetical protein
VSAVTRECVNTLIFIATYPAQGQNGGLSVKPWFRDFDTIFDVLHPSYDLATPTGMELSVRHKLGQPPQDEDRIRRILEKDLWCVSKSRVLVYDIDQDPGERFLTAAVLSKVPIIGVSETLRAAPAVFSGHIEAVYKPKDALAVLVRLQLATPAGAESAPVEAQPETESAPAETQPEA